MANVLYLVHRLPYPPNKGDKVRSFHVLKHLAARHRVFLGTFVDDPDDEQYVATVTSMCAGIHVARLRPRAARIASLGALASGQALTLRYYEDAGLRRWVEQTCAANRIDVALVFSSAMAQYLDGAPPLRTLVDFVDVDSAKWTQYAANHRWPLSWLYRREGERLLAYERAVAQRAEHSYFVTENEAELFRGFAPESRATVSALGNGVDAGFFEQDPARASPFADDVKWPIVFTGAMDYWPNIDAVTWFARDVMPRLLARIPEASFHIVGRSPTAAVKALAAERIHVAGTVPDVRPYLQHAAAVVAPLRLARGIQNKVLEAMAMARPVVASATCAEPIQAEAGEDLLTAADADGFVDRLAALRRDPARAAAIGRAGRACVLRRYTWEAHLSRIDERLEPHAGIAAPRETERAA